MYAIVIRYLPSHVERRDRRRGGIVRPGRWCRESDELASDVGFPPPQVTRPGPCTSMANAGYRCVRRVGRRSACISTAPAVAPATRTAWPARVPLTCSREGAKLQACPAPLARVSERRFFFVVLRLRRLRFDQFAREIREDMAP